MLLEVLPPLDWDKVGGETWGDVVQQVRKVGARKVLRRTLGSRGPCPRRAPGTRYSDPCASRPGGRAIANIMPPAYQSEPVSELERSLQGRGVCRDGRSLAADLRQDREAHSRTSQLVKPYVTAINFTDNPSAAPTDCLLGVLGHRRSGRRRARDADRRPGPHPRRPAIRGTGCRTTWESATSCVSPATA